MPCPSRCPAAFLSPSYVLSCLSPESIIALPMSTTKSLNILTTTGLSPLPVKNAPSMAARTRSMRGPVPSAVASNLTGTGSSPSISMSFGGSASRAAFSLGKKALRAPISVPTPVSRFVQPRPSYGRPLKKGKHAHAPGCHALYPLSRALFVVRAATASAASACDARTLR